MEDFFQTQSIEKRLKVIFSDKNLLFQAFVHRSYWNEHQETISGHNERLEFLGDSVLGLILADYLYTTYPDWDEGILSTCRSQLVDASACASYVQILEIESHLMLGKGELLNKGKGRESIAADLFEALLGALYLDQGLEAVRTFFFSHFQSQVDQIIAKPLHNWKAELQDYIQKNFQITPVYEVVEESGPAHAKHFVISVKRGAQVIGEGSGSSKKEAQTAAARDALEKLEGR